MAKHRIYTMSFARVYPLLVAKAEKKGRTKAEVDEIICWLTGYDEDDLKIILSDGTDFETFFAKAPRLNPSRVLIKGVQKARDIAVPVVEETKKLVGFWAPRR